VLIGLLHREEFESCSVVSALYVPNSIYVVRLHLVSKLGLKPSLIAWDNTKNSHITNFLQKWYNLRAKQHIIVDNSDIKKFMVTKVINFSK